MTGKHRLRPTRKTAGDTTGPEDTDRFHPVNPALAPEAKPVDPNDHKRKPGKPFLGARRSKPEDADGQP